MKNHFSQSYSLFRLPVAVFIVAVLFFGSFCFIPLENSTDRVGGKEDKISENHNGLLVSLSLTGLTLNTASAHGGQDDITVESGYLHLPTEEECCHAALHEKNHESAKGLISNQQPSKQMAVAHTSDVFDLAINYNSNFGYSGYLKNYPEGISPPASILRC